MLFGDDEEITGCEVAENVAENPELHFEIDPHALFAAIRAERAGGRKIAGYWHSHPSGDARPSLADAEAAAPDGKLWLIAGGDEVMAWRTGHGGLHGRFEACDLEETQA